MDVYLAALAGVAFGTGAAERAQSILTEASVETRLGITLVDLILAVRAREARAAGTGIAIDFIYA